MWWLWSAESCWLPHKLYVDVHPLPKDNVTCVVILIIMIINSKVMIRLDHHALLATCMVMSMPSPMLESAYIILFSGRSKPSLCRHERSRDPMLILWIIRIIAKTILMVIMVTLITVTVTINLSLSHLSFSPLLRWPFAPCEKKQSSRISNAVQFHHLKWFNFLL